MHEAKSLLPAVVRLTSQEAKLGRACAAGPMWRFNSAHFFARSSGGGVKEGFPSLFFLFSFFLPLLAPLFQPSFSYFVIVPWLSLILFTEDHDIQVGY